MLTALLSVFNEEYNIEECLECILQNRYFSSIHVIDDYSEDGTRELISRLASRHDRIIPHYNTTNSGTVKSIWSVAQYLEKGYVLFASASDRLLPNLTEQAYSDLIKNPTVGLWTAKSLYFKTLPLSHDYLPDCRGMSPVSSRVLTQYEASYRYIRTGMCFEGSCTLFSIPLMRYFGLDYRLGGFADLLLGIQCLCHSGQILSSSFHSMVQENQPGHGYLESSYMKLRLHKVNRWVDESYAKFTESSPDNRPLHQRYARCLQVTKALISYGYSRRFPGYLTSLLLSKSMTLELARLRLNRMLQSSG